MNDFIDNKFEPHVNPYSDAANNASEENVSTTAYSVVDEGANAEETTDNKGAKVVETTPADKPKKPKLTV